MKFLHFPVYIRNEGNVDMTISLSTENWSPSNASSYVTLDWDYAGQCVGSNKVIQVLLTLSICSSIEGITTFSFDIAITGSG